MRVLSLVLLPPHHQRTCARRCAGQTTRWVCGGCTEEMGDALSRYHKSVMAQSMQQARQRGAVLIQRNTRMCVQRMRYIKLLWALTGLQSAFRGIKARRVLRNEFRRRVRPFKVRL